jgi:hypothetical protein
MEQVFILWSNRVEVINAVTLELGDNTVCVAVNSVKHLEKLLSEFEISGILIDMVKQVRTASSDRQIVLNLADIFPTIRVNWNYEKSQLLSLYSGLSSPPIRTLSDFVQFTGNCFSPRFIRKSKRIPLNMNVVLEAENIEIRSCTLNVSESGLFIFTDNPDELPRELNIQINELGSSPIKAEVVRHVSWGTELKASGIGIKFNGLDELYKNQLKKILRNAEIS